MNKIEKLIPMVEFVKHQSFGYTNGFIPLHEFHATVLNYAEFLSTKLTPSMFVPCDEKGKPLSEKFTSDKQEQDFEKHKENLFFKNFNLLSSQGHVATVESNHDIIGVGFKNGVYQNVESVCKKGITLTDRAIKLIYS